MFLNTLGLLRYPHDEKHNKASTEASYSLEKALEVKVGCIEQLS